MKVVVMLHTPRSAPDDDTPLDHRPGIAPADLAALRLGADLAAGGGELIAATVGPASDEAVLARALELGADRAIRIWSAHSVTDNLWSITRLAASALREVGFDALLAGDRSVNWGSGMTGPTLAHQLGIPHVSAVLTASADDGRLRIARRHGDRTMSLALPTPALLTAAAAGPRRDGHDASAREGSLPAIEQLDLTDRTPTAPVSLYGLNVEPVPATAEMLDSPDALLAYLRKRGLLT